VAEWRIPPSRGILLGSSPVLREIRTQVRFNDTEERENENMNPHYIDKILRRTQDNPSRPSQQLSTVEQMALDQINQDIAALSKERDSLEDLERQSTNLTNHHSARRLKGYNVVKIIDAEGNWAGLYRVEPKAGTYLPPELQQSWTTVENAIKAVTAYLNQKKLNTQGN
jgi:hypothetical protein